MAADFVGCGRFRDQIADRCRIFGIRSVAGDTLQRLLQVVLSAWREAERVAAERSETSQEHKAALVAADRLRGLYGELLDSAKADDDAAVIESVPPLGELGL
jgi:hypothetical protein